MTVLELEKVPENKVNAWCDKQGILHFKVVFREAGWPDRLYITPFGTHAWIEWKRPGKKPDPLQDERLKELINRGVKACWTDNYDDAIYFLSNLDTSDLPAKGR